MSDRFSFPDRIKYVLFDMDDVLVSTRPLDKEVKTQVFVPVGLHWEQIAEHSHLPMKELVPFLFGEYSISENPAAYIEKYFSLYDELLSERLEANAVPGVVDLIHKLSDSMAGLALVTSSTLTQARIVTAGLGISDKFKILVTANDITKGKPDPEPYQKAVYRLEARPAACAVIEDLPTGIASAKAVSPEIYVIAITTTRQPDVLGQADMIINNYSQLVA